MQITSLFFFFLLHFYVFLFFFFFFQAEDGIRDIGVTGVRRVLFRSRPANWYSDSWSGTGVTAPRMVAGSAPSATAIGKGWPGRASRWSRKSSAPPRCDSQRIASRLGDSTCWR